MPEFATYGRQQVGDARLHHLCDGGGEADPRATFPSSTDGTWARHAAALNAEGRFVTTIGALLIELPGRTVLLDTGIGPLDVDIPGIGTFRGGGFLDSLAESGVEPEAIDDVILSHLHVDHVGWLTRQDGKDGWRLRFRNARHHIMRAEWDFWRSSELPSGPDPERVIAPLEGALNFVEDGEELAPGLTIVGTPGHTPGHLSLRIEREGARALVLSDLLFGWVQMAEPELSLAFDLDVPRATESRRRILAEAADSGALVVACHMADGIFGRVVEAGEGYCWQPVG